MLVVAPDSPERLRRYWQDHHLDFWAVADHTGEMLSALGQEVVWWRLGRMPALLGINQTGQLVYRHLGRSMQDLPAWDEAIEAVLRP